MTDPRPCPVPRRDGTCGRPTPDGVICTGCTRQLERIFADLPAWLGELETAIARQSRVSGRTGGKPTKKAAQPLPFDAAAAELAHRVRNELTTAIRHLCESRSVKVPQIDRTADMALWLVGNVESIRQDEAAVETVTWARSLRDAIRWQVDNLGTRFAGPCHARIAVLQVGQEGAECGLIATDADEVAEYRTETALDDPETGESLSALPVRYVERECGTDLRMRSGAETVKCRACGTEHAAADLLADVIQRNHEHMARASEISDWLTRAGWPVKAATIRKWAERGKLYPWREDDLGRPLYMVGDVLGLVVAGATREASA